MDREVRAFIFDLDGVLVFTDKYHYQAWKKMADRIGVYFDETVNNRLRGISRMKSLDIILERAERQFSDHEKNLLAEEKNRYYFELLSAMKPSDVTMEVRDTLRKLQIMGYKLAIGSSSKNAKYILERVQLLEVFDTVSDGTNITKSKPDPEVFLKAAEFLGEKPENCIVVEDACAGIDAAVNSGMKAIGIGEAAGYNRTDYPIHTFADIMEVCKFI